MLDKVMIGRYLQSDSFIHTLDARTKLVAAFVYIILIFAANNLPTYGLFAAFLLLGIALSRVSLSIYLNSMRPLMWLLIFSVVLQVLFVQGGDVYFSWGIINISSIGLLNGLYIFLRFTLVILMSTLLTLTTAPLELADAIEHLMNPLKKLNVPVHEIALMLSIALRFVPTLMDEAQKIMNAQRARGSEFGEGNIIKQIKAIVPILVPLFVSSFNRADELATAMESRGYRGSVGRTKYRVLTYGKKDYIVLASTAFLVVLVIVVSMYATV